MADLRHGRLSLPVCLSLAHDRSPFRFGSAGVGEWWSDESWSNAGRLISLGAAITTDSEISFPLLDFTVYPHHHAQASV